MAKKVSPHVFVAWFDDRNLEWTVEWNGKLYHSHKIRLIAVANGNEHAELKGLCQNIVEVEGELVIT